MGWIGVDFDGVLAVRVPGWVNPYHQWSQGLRDGCVTGMTSGCSLHARMTGNR